MVFETEIGGVKIRLVKGDITELEVDAIVNAANSSMWMGGGVAGAIKRKGGKVIEEEARRQAPVPVGGAIATSAGKLKAKYVIHAVGPRWGEGDEEAKLARATLNSLRLAERLGLKSIAFPAISAGAFGCPKELSAKAMLSTVLKYVKEGGKVGEIIFCLYDDETYRVFEGTLKDLLSR